MFKSTAILHSLLTCLILFSLSISISNGQNTPTDGDWSANNVVLPNTNEADIMIRVGDIDNLNFGWENDFNPFLGKPTSVHEYPWAPNKKDIPCMDRILIPSSMGKVKNGCNMDGYSQAGNLATKPVLITIPLQSAKSCKQYLVSKGIDESRISAMGYGPDQPIAENDSESNRAKNRRVEMKIVKM